MTRGNIPNPTEGNRMTVRKVVAGSVLAAGLGVLGMLGAGSAFADASANATDATGTNPTTQDAMGFGNVNHMSEGWNNGFNGIGHLRSVSKGDTSDFAGTNRVKEACKACVSLQEPTKVGKGR
jgi:hypothetical protein